MICGDETSISDHINYGIQMAIVEMSPFIYYFIVNQEMNNQPIIINRKLSQTDRCQRISELFNETFVQMSQIRRIKYYHLPCQTHVNLSCFYDDTYMCLCNEQRFAECFEFNHKAPEKNFDIDYKKMDIACSTNNSTQSSSSLTPSTTLTSNDMTSIYICKYLPYLFILLVCLYVHCAH